MSHFTVLVVGKDLEEALQPFHEFECTGTNDQYVIDQDKTAELLEQIAGGESLESALGDYGFQDLQVQSEAEVDRDETHKYGFAVVGNGVLIKAVKRTNPNKKWDWYQVGGRWKGKLLTKDGRRVDQAIVGDIDFDGMIASCSHRAAKLYDDVFRVIAGREFLGWKSCLARHKAGEITIEEARNLFNSQVILKDLAESKVVDKWDASEVLEPILASDRTTYIQGESKLNASTWAFLNERTWLERGSMGWFGMSDANDESTSTYLDIFWKTVKALHADEILTVVDCHI